MPKKNVGVRLEQETIDALSKRGSPSTVIREIVLNHLNPQSQKVKVETKIIEKVVEKVVEKVDLRLVNYWEDLPYGWTKEGDRDVILHEISNPKISKLYIELRKKDFKNKWGEDVEIENR